MRATFFNPHMQKPAIPQFEGNGLGLTQSKSTACQPRHRIKWNNIHPDRRAMKAAK
jgi:hypothetical protein